MSLKSTMVTSWILLDQWKHHPPVRSGSRFQGTSSTSMAGAPPRSLARSSSARLPPAGNALGVRAVPGQGLRRSLGGYASGGDPTHHGEIMGNPELRLTQAEGLSCQPTKILAEAERPNHWEAPNQHRSTTVTDQHGPTWTNPPGSEAAKKPVQKPVLQPLEGSMWRCSPTEPKPGSATMNSSVQKDDWSIGSKHF